MTEGYEHVACISAMGPLLRFCLCVENRGASEEQRRFGCFISLGYMESNLESTHRITTKYESVVEVYLYFTLLCNSCSRFNDCHHHYCYRNH